MLSLYRILHEHEGEEGHHHEDSTASLNGNKVGALFVILAVGVIGAILPFLIRRTRLRKTILLMNAVAAGAFLGLALFHLFPEGIELMEEAHVGFYIRESFYNLSPLFVVLGYLLILFVEHVFYIPGVDEEMLHKHTHAVPTQPDEVTSHMELPNRGHPRLDTEQTSACDSCVDVKRSFAPSIVKTIRTYSGDSMIVPNSPPPKVNFSSVAFIALLALSLHAIFAGMVVGLADEVSQVWLTTVCIVGHKWAEGFALACAFLEHNVTTLATVIYLGLFCLVSPLGVAIGIPLSSTSESVEGIFNSLATGTILYVGMGMASDVFLSPMPTKREILSHRRKFLYDLYKFAAFSTGLFGIFGLTIIHHLSGHEH